MCRARNRLQLAAVSERNGILLVVSLSFLAGCLSALRLTGGLWLWGLAGLSLLMGWLLRRLGAGAGIALAFCFFALGALRLSLIHISRPACRWPSAAWSASRWRATTPATPGASSAWRCAFSPPCLLYTSRCV